MAAIAAAVVLALSCAALVFSSGPTSAASFPKTVYGHVYDSADHAVEGATVSVEIWNGGTLRYTEPDVVSECDGFYTVSIGGDYWDIGNTIKVTATFGLVSGTGSVAADGGPTQTVDVHFAEEIPEFSMMLVPAFLMVALFMLARAGRRNR